MMYAQESTIPSAGFAAMEEPLPLKRPSTRTPKELGRKGERLAQTFLEAHGLEILQTNWRCQAGEVDIVARDGATVVLVEVKTRLARGLDTNIQPELAVGQKKRAKYHRLALLYLSLHPEVESVRFDVVAVSVLGPNRAHVHYLSGAYSWDEQ